jgi:hypothetical protein
MTARACLVWKNRISMPVDLDWVSGQKILGSEHEMLRAAVL